MRGYGKEVKERNRRRAAKRVEKRSGRKVQDSTDDLSNSSLSTTKGHPHPPPSSPTSPTFMRKGVEDWGEEEVVGWLSHLNLDCYLSSFQSNQMTSGSMLLEVRDLYIDKK